MLVTNMLLMVATARVETSLGTGVWVILRKWASRAAASCSAEG